MIKFGIDRQALADQFEQATAQQGEALRKAVGSATLKALQGRELTLAHVRQVLKQVAEAASAGAARNTLPAADVAALLAKATAGMDKALLQAVQAHRKALQQFVDQGMALKEAQMQSALANIEKMETVFFKAVSTAAKGADSALQGPWKQVLGAMKQKGTDTGTQAIVSLDHLAAQAQLALREGRSASLRGTQTLMKGYTALVSGVLIGMSDAFEAPADAPIAAPAAPTAVRTRKQA
jgi:hypothetical protein